MLEWKRAPVFSSTKEKIVLGIEAELVFPELKRLGAERYWPTNRLRFARARRLPESCYYQDNYFLDRCENWTLGIEISPECLYRVLPRELEINYTGIVPPSTTTARYQIQTVGIDTVPGKGFTKIGKYVGPTQESQLVGEFCSTFCETCFSPATGWIEKSLCLPLAKLKNPYATVDWLEAFCPSCEAAKNQSPEWRNFRIDQVQCVEPVHVPGTTASYSCVRSPYADGCDPVDVATPQHICMPGEKRCSGANRETCSADGLRWGNGFTCGCGCNGNDCGAVNTCSAGTKTCLDSSRLSTCNADTCGSTVKVCPCGCTNNACQNQVCTTSYCRDSTTLVQCINAGCGTQVVSCGYGCSNNRCNDAPGTPDMSSGGGSFPDMSVISPPPDLAGPATPEVCDGVDNDKNGILDDPSSCWLGIYRFKDPITGARCYGPSTTAPFACATYTLERGLFMVPAYPWLDGSTTERVQCSRGIDHIITVKGGGEYSSLVTLGWNCSLSLGYFFNDGRAPRYPLRTPFTNAGSIYRQKITLPAGDTHLFTVETETITGSTCELPTRGEALTNTVCGKPSGC